DRGGLVSGGMSGGIAAVLGSPISGVLFGIEVLYLGRIESPVLFPGLVSGIVAHLVCGVRAPVPALAGTLASFGRTEIVFLSIAAGAAFGVAALLLIETMRGVEKAVRRFEGHPYAVAAAGGVFLAIFYRLAGPEYSGLGVETIGAAL